MCDRSEEHVVTSSRLDIGESRGAPNGIDSDNGRSGGGFEVRQMTTLRVVDALRRGTHGGRNRDCRGIGGALLRGGRGNDAVATSYVGLTVKQLSCERLHMRRRARRAACRD